MTTHHVRTPAPSHWHIFREVEGGGKQYMLPIYRHHAQAIAAADGLKQGPHRQYGVEACQHKGCHT